LKSAFASTVHLELRVVPSLYGGHHLQLKVARTQLAVAILQLRRSTSAVEGGLAQDLSLMFNLPAGTSCFDRGIDSIR
jgi:hypothetical protein